MQRFWLVFGMVLMCGLLFAAPVLGSELPGVLFTEDFEIGSEDMPPGWTVFSAGGEMRRTTEVAHSGKYSYVIIDNDSELSAGIRSPLFPITAGKEYEVSSWALVSGQGAQLYLEFWDSSKNVRLAALWTSINAQSEWQYVVNRNYAPENAEYLSVIIYVGKAAISKAYFDDITVVDIEALLGR